MAAPPLEAARASRPGEVIDAHVHLFTAELLEEWLVTLPPGEMQGFRTAVRERRFGRHGDRTLPDISPAQAARWYVERLRAADVAKALVVSIVPDNQWTREFLVAANGHVHALCNLDPRDAGAPALLEHETAAGFRGVKLLPVNRCYRLSDPACRPCSRRLPNSGFR